MALCLAVGPPCVVPAAIAVANAMMSKSKPGSKPKNCPAGTLPIDKYPGLSKDDVHDIKDAVGARPNDWTDIDPDGNVVTGDHNGDAVDNGPYGPMVNHN